MDAEKYMLLLKGADKTEQVSQLQVFNNRYNVTFAGSPKVYTYGRDKLQLLELRRAIDPAGKIVSINGVPAHDVVRILDFGPKVKVIFKNGRSKTVDAHAIHLEANCLNHKRNRDLFRYFKETAEAVGLVVEGRNILALQYDRVNAVSEETVLANYLDPTKPLAARTPPDVLIYPFGLNQSQKIAVENAFSSQVSIIQGPPGTGKTQTILNIVANAVRNGKTVAVVSNNNSATHNVVEKLEKKHVSFLTAFLGNTENKEKFLEAQTGQYPVLGDWALEAEETQQLDADTAALSHEVNEMLNAKNRISAIGQELLELKPERVHFNEYYAACGSIDVGDFAGLGSKQILTLWLEYESYAERESKLGLLKKISILFRFNKAALKLFVREPDLVIPYLQDQYYKVRRAELLAERAALEKKLEHYRFQDKLNELTAKSLRLFRAELARSYGGGRQRRRFEKVDFRRDSGAFNREYPIVLSTTYSIKGTLSFDHVYDYLIVDESSQVDLATGVLALSCARNVVIVGDLQQLPNVLTGRDIQMSDAIWNRYNLRESYHFATHSLLASAVEIWKDAPSVLLREHYRCHPKIINFCNQKFYHGQLIVMTEDHDEPDVLTMYRTAQGNHARGHQNQRQIDVIHQEVLPRLAQHGYDSIGIITPYCDQVDALRKQLGSRFEIDTVHKFQGREQDAIVLTSVDNVIGDFVDDANMLNVAVSRAVKSLTVVTSQDPRNDKTNYGDLARYIQYHNCEVIDSTVRSVFDLLYKGYAQERRDYLQKHRRISEYDSENLMYSVIETSLLKPEFSKLGCAAHVSLSALIKDFSLLSEPERLFARNPLTHTDFLLFNKMDKSPVLAIEVDGVSFHPDTGAQADRDRKKNSIFQKCGIPLLRLRTDGSEEAAKLEQALRAAL